MKQQFKSKQHKTLLSYFLLAVAIILAYKIIQSSDMVFKYINQFLNIISPFIYGFLLAYILNLPSNGIQKLLTKTNNNFICKKSKVLSILITYLLLFLILFLVLRLIIPSISNSIYYFIANYQTYYSHAQDFIHYINDLNIIEIDVSMNKILSTIQTFGLEKLPDSISALFGVSSAIFRGFLALISSIYILFEKDNFKKYLCRLLNAFLPGTFYRAFLRYTRELNHNFKQYIYTQTIDGCILGTVAIIELYLLGSPYALILGLMLGFINYIPYFGSIFGSAIAIIVIAFTQSVPTAGLAAVILLVTQQIDGNIIQPRLMGGSFALSPLLIIVSITIGGAFYGILGMLAAIPIVAVLKNIIDEVVTYYESRKLDDEAKEDGA